MGKIVLSEQATLDGVIQDPTGDEGFEHGGWAGRIHDRTDIGKVLLAEATRAEALLLGRRSYEFFAARWPSRSGDLADRLNSLPKYIVSTTLEEPAWRNSTVLGSVSEVSEVKRELDGDIVSYASFRLGRTLLAHNLVDELRLVIYPVVLGAGERLFDQTGGRKGLRLRENRTIGTELVCLTYEIGAG